MTAADRVLGDGGGAVDLAVARDHPAFDGHFPGRPLLPGVVLVAEALEALLDDAGAAAALGPRPRLGAAKFVSPARPGERLRLTWRRTGRRVAFEVHRVGGPDGAASADAAVGVDASRATVEAPAAPPPLVASGHFERDGD